MMRELLVYSVIYWGWFSSVCSTNLSLAWKSVTKKSAFQLPSPNLEFDRFEECRSPERGREVTLPKMGLDFEMQISANYPAFNRSYKSATFSDGKNALGVVAFEFLDQKEIILYDWNNSLQFHVKDKKCVKEPLLQASCNPLTYFIFRDSESLNNKSGWLSPCSFQVSKAVYAQQQPNAGGLRGSAQWQHKWTQCLRFHRGPDQFLFLLTSSFRTNPFAMHPTAKYIPLSLEVVPLQIPAAGKSAKASTRRVDFQFESFRPRLRPESRSIFQNREYAGCAGWRGNDSGARGLNREHRN